MTIGPAVGEIWWFIDYLQNGGRPPTWIHVTHIGRDQPQKLLGGLCGCEKN